MARQLLYHDEPGKPSPEDYIHTTQPKERAEILLRLQTLCDIPITEWPKGWIKHLKGKLWEFKYKSHRIFYFLQTEKIVVVHAMMKVGRRTPRNDIDLAERRMANYLELPDDTEKARNTKGRR